MIRLLTGLVAGACWLLVLFLHTPIILFVVVTILIFLGLREYYTISFEEDEKPAHFLAIILSCLPVLMAYTADISYVMAALVISFILQSLLVIAKYRTLKKPFLFGIKISFGTFYLGLSAAHLYLLSTLADGWFWLFLLSIIITASDSGAYYVGTTFGRRKLCPFVSPGKTIEGLLGGMFFAALGATVTTLVLRPDINLMQIIPLAIILAGLGVIGDLTESIFKRSYNIKDSGTILPGHGGILDRVDSFLLTAPTLYYALYLL